MQYQEFRKIFEPIGVFPVNDVFKINESFDRKQLVQWQKKGYLKKIINRWYCFTGIPLNEKTLFFIANKIYTPSYISCESALSWYGLIPEAVYSIVSATSIKTNEFNTPSGTFAYRHLNPKLMFGYTLISSNAFYVKIAEPEKAILDYLYLHKKINTAAEISGMRMNPEIFRKKIIKKKMFSYLSLFNNRYLEKQVKILLELFK